MRPILLQGHTRSLTKIKYNREGDLLFSCSKDSTPCVWYSHNGERLGTYNGHKGTVWTLDSNFTTTRLLTGSADNTCRLWDAETGKQIASLQTLSPVRAVSFSHGDRLALVVTEQRMNHPSMMYVVDLTSQDFNVVVKENMDGSRPTVAGWGFNNKYIITGHEDGEIALWDPKVAKRVKAVKGHAGSITDLQFSQDMMYFITSSKDNSAKLWDARTMESKKRFVSDRPVNSAAISPLKDHIMLGGGQEAMSVTTTSARAGKFEVRFFHRIFEEEIGRVKGHFGPINTLAFHPDGRSFSSGGEDGYIRVHNFDDDYFNFDFEY